MRNGIVILPIDQVRFPDIGSRPFQNIARVICTKRPTDPAQLPEELCEIVEAELASWERCFTGEAVKRLKRELQNQNCDKELLVAGAKGHRRKFELAEKGQVRIVLVRIVLEEYRPLVREVIGAGFSLTIEESGKPHVLQSKPLHGKKFG